MSKDDIAARMAKLGTAPDTPAQVPSKQAKSPARRTPKATSAEQAKPMPAEQTKPATYSARINLTTTPDQNRALDMARIDDGIDKTARLRAMIAYWQNNERHRKVIDNLAKEWR